MFLKICIIVKVLTVQITVSQTIHQGFGNTLFLPEITKRCTRQINHFPLPANGMPIGNVPFQNSPRGNALLNEESNGLNKPPQNFNNLAVDRLTQNGNSINNNANGLAWNNMPPTNSFLNLNNLAKRDGFQFPNSNSSPFRNSISISNNMPMNNNVLMNNNMPMNNNLAMNNNILLNGHNEQKFNGFQNFNNIQTPNGFINNGASVNSLNSMSYADNFQLANSAPINLQGCNNLENNFPVNSINSIQIPNTNNMLSNGMANLAQNNLQITNGLQNSLLNNNNVYMSNGITNFPQDNMGNGFGNCLLNQEKISNNLPMGNEVDGSYDFQIANGVGNLNNGLDLSGNNIPNINDIFENGPQLSINDAFTITSNMPLPTIVPRNVINKNVPFCNNGITTNEAFSAVDQPVNRFSFNNWLGSNNFPISNHFSNNNNFQSYNNMPSSNNMPRSTDWLSDYTVANLRNKHNIFQNSMPLGNQEGFANNVNFGKEMGTNNNLQIGDFGNLPILNGMPVTGITESVTVLNNSCR